ncbi:MULTISPECIES: DMT family transporter [unclassified Duganella]|jgi:inner membrane transporter RhtA|uniref:EamA family transporter n=1 Tax=unclassified Duganella TaxID=2636909 RepID=UPI0008907101|nr:MULTISPECIES: DMT family transporter [unclassified Duganella]SDH56356.1 inner membrane transporter RhtA [Duganella sp. OV458]SDK67043.1 inner membrane transporter RhtA [Duganella sp. OV510]
MAEDKTSVAGNPWLAGLALLCSQLSLNVGAAFAKNLFPKVGVEGVTAYRVGISALIMLAMFRPWRTRLTWKQAVNVAIYGSVIGIMNLMIYRAFARIPMGIAVAIEVAGPLTVAVLSSHRPRDIVAVCLAVAGLYFLLPIHGHVDQLDPVGVAYAAGAAVCWALYIVYGKRVSAMSGGQSVAWGMLAASVFIVPIGAAHTGMDLLTPSFLLVGTVIAVMSSAVPYTLEMLSMRTLSSRTFSMFSSAAPALSALAGMFVLGEHLTLTQWLAITAIVMASALTSLR